MSDLYHWRHSLRHYLARQADVAHLGIRPTDLVLDLASGQDPYPRANILCDKFVADSRERACRASIVMDRPFVLADATATPFPDKAFDFVYCAHLLEHMEQPEQLLHELQRIGRRGYIETPSPIYEKLWGWHFHRWFVTLDGKRLVIQAKDRVLFDDDLHDWFSAQIERRPVWEFFMSRLKDLELLTMLVWDGEITYEIRGQASPDVPSFVQAELGRDRILEETTAGLSLCRPSQAQQVKRLLGRWARRHSDRRVKEVLDALICPNCHSSLGRFAEHWQCDRCKAAYPILGGVPVMLREVTQTLADAPVAA
jgi:uncharacterized protein YbaR (Trm112 family)